MSGRGVDDLKWGAGASDNGVVSTVRPHPAVPAAPTRPARLLAMFVACVALVVYGSSLAAGPAAAAESYTFTGGGWGHGVGMSQWGARGMAEQGSSFDQILRHYYTGTEVGTRAVADDLKVLIAERSGSLLLTAGGTTTIHGLGTFGAGHSVALSRSGNSIVANGAVEGTIPDAVLITYAGAGDLTVSPPGYSYRYGALAVMTDPAGGLRAVIGGLGMQQYLYGLGEMFSTWPAEALKAQATAGRTFAQKQREARDGDDFHLYGSVLHQAYTGTRTQVPSWTAAVDATDRRVVTHGGALIDAVYSASSGGHTENSEIVWVSAVPYLRGVPDPADAGGGNPNAGWSRTYTAAQLGAWFGLGNVTSVQILGNTGASNRVDKATVRLVGTGGTRDVAGASFRSIVNANSPGAQLMSTRFSLGGQSDAPAAPPPPPSSTMPSGNFHTAFADGRTVVVGGTSSDPDGHPLVRVVSTMGSERAVRDYRSTNGSFLLTWTGSPGTRNICVTVFDVPTNQGVSLGCRDVVVK